MWEFNKYVDFKKAYDSIYRASLINILREFKFPKKLGKLVKANINGTKIKVVSQYGVTTNGTSDRPETRGCAISDTIQLSAGEDSKRNQLMLRS